jgi:hypothetical protein
VLTNSPAMIVSFGELRDGAAHPRLAGSAAPRSARADYAE